MSFQQDTKIGFFVEYSYLCEDVKSFDMGKNNVKLSFLTLLAALICLSGCADIKRLEDLSVDSIKISSVSPKGFRGVKLVLDVEVDNPGAQVSLSEISATLEHSGKILGVVAVDPFVLDARSDEIYSLNADVDLGEEASVADLGRLLNKKALDETLVDVSAKVRIRKGIVRKVEFNDVPLKKLLETVK